MPHQETTIYPLSDHVMVELEEAQDKTTDGGIVIPAAFTRGTAVRTEVAKVLGKGPGRITKKGALIAAEVEPNDRVLIKRSLGTEFKAGDKRLVILKPADILAVIQ